MAEEQFTSRRARREAERLAAEQAFEAQETPEQPSEPSSNDPAGPLTPQPEPAEDSALRPDAPQPHPGGDEAEPPEPASSLDPQQAPLPHFDTRTARKNYLREHGLSLDGDVSTGAIPVIAAPEEIPDSDSIENPAAEHETFDAAGFGGSADEVAARDFEAPVTTDSAPRPTALDEEPDDALSRPLEDLDTEDTPPAAAGKHEASGYDEPLADGSSQATATPESEDPSPDAPAHAEPDAPAHAEEADSAEAESAESAPRSRSRRMPIVQPPSTSGVRVVTAASAQIPEVDDSETTTDAGPPSAAGADTETDQDQSTENSADAPAPGDASPAADADEAAPPTSSDDAARALAADPETRPMEAVPEAWALPNPDYEDEETENPPGTRVRASAVTGQDGRILVGEEPSKVPYVVLGVAALFAVALIVIALVMLL